MVRSRKAGRTPARGIAVVVAICALRLTGCHSGGEIYFRPRSSADATFKPTATDIATPNVAIPEPTDLLASPPPRTLQTAEPSEIWDLSLEEAVQLALAHSQVMRDLGSRVLSTPDAVRTVYEPALQESDPRFGVQGALSAFDAQLTSQIFWEKNDRILNNFLLAGGTSILQQDYSAFQTQVAKTAATGGQFFLRNNINYDANNRTFNIFPSAWDVNYEAGFRQPLLQGAGVEFNRIAGPGAAPGLYFRNGVILARIDNDITLAEFEIGVRDLVNQVETAYWELYFAYRALDATTAARDAALETWRKVSHLRKSGAVGGDLGSEAAASAQYFEFRANVENARSGLPHVAPVQTGAGWLRGTGGVYSREAELRTLMGITQNDGRLIRPSDEPTSAPVTFDWNEAVAESLMRRVELRRQQWRIRRAEMQLVAERNFLRPRLDAQGLYRWRGFGDDLLSSDRNASPIDNAYQNLTGGNFQEWQLGATLEIPIGFRQAFAAVRQAQLRVSRERAVLDEQERLITANLAGAVRELHRAQAVTQSHMNLWHRTRDVVVAAKNKFDAGTFTVDQLLAAQRALAEAELAYFRSLVSYNMALKSIHYEKGSLLDYNQIYLAEGPWPGKAYTDAMRRARAEAAARPLNYGITKPDIVSLGRFPQQVAGSGGPIPEVVEPVAPPEGALPAGPVVPDPLELPEPPAASLPAEAGGTARLAPHAPAHPVVGPVGAISPIVSTDAVLPAASQPLLEEPPALHESPKVQVPPAVASTALGETSPPLVAERPRLSDVPVVGEPVDNPAASTLESTGLLLSEFPPTLAPIQTPNEAPLNLVSYPKPIAEASRSGAAVSAVPPAHLRVWRLPPIEP